MQYDWYHIDVWTFYIGQLKVSQNYIKEKVSWQLQPLETHKELVRYKWDLSTNIILRRYSRCIYEHYKNEVYNNDLWWEEDIKIHELEARLRVSLSKITFILPISSY